MSKNNKPTVKVFTTSACGFCRVVKGYLAALEVEFEEVDIGANREAAEWVLENVGRPAVPVTLFNDAEFVLGWDKSAIDDQLKKLKLIR